MLRGRFLVAAAIVLFWLAMTGLLVQREVLVPYAERAAGTMGEYDTWMGIYVPQADGSSEKLGYVNSSAKRETRDGQPGFAYTLLFKMRVSLLNMPSEMRVDGAAWIPQGGVMSSFSFIVASGKDHAMHIDGEIVGETVQLTVKTANESFPVNLPLDSNFLFSGAMGATTLNLPELEVGDEVMIESFDPMTMSMGRARVQCIGAGTYLFEDNEFQVRKLAIAIGGLTSETWVTEDEEVVYVKTPIGMELRKEPAFVAMKLDDTAAAAGLMTKVSIQPEGLRPFSGARTMEFTVSGLPEGIRPPSDAIQQHIEDNRYRTVVPATHDAAPLEALDDAAPFLGGDMLVQTGHARVKTALDGILAGGEESWPLAMRLYDWVYSNIEKSIVLSFPSALEVLETRQGDCNEHTVLYAALARTAGLPTKIAIGVVWSDTFGGFYYHAWPEVYVGRWIPMDPTLGQPIADATHIKLLEGSIEQWPGLVPYLGQMQLEITEIE